MLTRIITGIIGIIIAIGVITKGGLIFSAAVLFLAAVGWYELRQMAAAKEINVYYLTSGLGTLLIVGIAAMGYYSGVDPLFQLAFFTMFIALFFIFNTLEGLVRHCKLGEANWISSTSLSIWGMVYCGILFAHVIIIRGLPGFPVNLGFTVLDFGEALLWTVLLGTWASDTVAYFFGSAFGKRPFCSVSPKKSLEGAAAGFIGCTAVVTWLAHSYLYMQTWQAVVLALGIAFFAPLGDLVESIIKRSFDIKDSGKIFPGHGGVLDRFDSFLFAAPITYYLLIILSCF